MFLLLLSWIAISTMVHATLPSFITYSVTVRDFLAQGCRTGLSGYPSAGSQAILNRWCPSAGIAHSVLVTQNISGHPDFQRDLGNSLYQLYLYGNSATKPYTSSKYMLPGKPFPLTHASGTYAPIVTVDLMYGTTGIPKMTFCSESLSATEEYACDSAKTTDKAVYSAQSFASWYEDDRRYNKRMGYLQKFKLNPATKQYGFDSQFDTPEDFYDPITLNGLTNQAWPRSAGELDDNNKPQKFFFTTEIHTSFEYNGTESFSFSGDDDVHVFFNGRLAINLGGLHSALGRSILLKNYERELNLTRGGVYQFDMFHAERQVTASNFQMTTTLASTCNVMTSDFKTNGTDVESTIDWTSNGKTTNADWIAIAGPGFGEFSRTEPKTFELMAPQVPNVVSYLFYNQGQVNVGSGFRFQFQFRMTGTLGHGFAILFHDRSLGLSNFNGGTGPNLGIKNNDNSFAVVFDMLNPNKQELRVHYNLLGDKRNSVSNLTRTVYDGNVVQNWKDNAWHFVEVLYYAKPDWLEIYVDNSLRLVERNFNMTEIIGGRDASIGFSSSSSEEAQALSVSLRNVVMKTVKVLPRNSEMAMAPGRQSLLADGRNTVSFTFASFDACKNPVDYGGLSHLVQGRMVGNFPPSDLFQRRRQLAGSENTTTVLATVVDLRNGKYDVRFSATQSGNYSTYLAFGTNCTWVSGTGYLSNSNCFAKAFPNSVLATPFITFAPTTITLMPTVEPLPDNSLDAVGISVGVVSACGLMAILFGVRIRNRWRKDRLYIEKGRLAVLDRGMEFDGGDNDLNFLQNKLQDTLHAVQAERAKNQFEGKEETINRLLQQRGELQEMVRRMKRKAQGLDPNEGFDEPTGFTSRVRKSFAPGRMSARSTWQHMSVADESGSNDLPAPVDANSNGGVFARLRQSMRRPLSFGKSDNSSNGNDVSLLYRMRQSMKRKPQGGASQLPLSTLQELDLTSNEEGNVNSGNPLFAGLKQEASRNSKS